MFQRHQSDNVSITNSLFTAVDHLEDDDNSSTENLRHGYLPTQQVDHIIENNESINTLVKKLNVQTSVVWQGKHTSSFSLVNLIIPFFSDYRPQYQLLNESYDNVKKGKCITNNCI